MAKSTPNDIIMKERKRWGFFGIPWTFTTYTITEKKLIIKKGFLNQIEDEILLFRIRDLTLSRKFTQRIFGLGSIFVVSSDKNNKNEEIKNIRNVQTFRDALSNRVDMERIRNKTRSSEIDVADDDMEDDIEL